MDVWSRPCLQALEQVWSWLSGSPNITPGLDRQAHWQRDLILQAEEETRCRGLKRVRVMTRLRYVDWACHVHKAVDTNYLDNPMNGVNPHVCVCGALYGKKGTTTTASSHWTATQSFKKRYISDDVDQCSRAIMSKTQAVLCKTSSRAGWGHNSTWSVRTTFVVRRFDAHVNKALRKVAGHV